MKKITYILFALAAMSSNAQVLSYDFYTFRLNNMFNVNPAYAGKGDSLNIVLNAQSQGKGVSYNNKNFILGIFSKVSGKQALGAKLISDTRGAFQVLRADLSYAYITKVAEQSTLSLGLSAGVLNNNIAVSRIENYQALDQSDPTLNQSNGNTQFVAGAGILFMHKALEVSLSSPHILTTNQNLNAYLNTAVFYTIKADEKIKVTPWICYQNIPVTKSIFSGQVKAMYKERMWLQVGYQTNKTLNAAVGVNIENLSLVYGFKFSNKQFTDVTSGSHEVTFLFKIGQRKKSMNTATGNDNLMLNDIVKRLEKLSGEPVTKENKESAKAELDEIKKQLQKLELDNSTPEKAEQVSKLLQQVDEKLKLIEKKLSND